MPVGMVFWKAGFPCWLVSVWRGVWVHKISLVNIIIKLIIAGFGGKARGGVELARGKVCGII